MLQISNLSKTYPNGVRALNNLSLEIGKGMFGLLGPNGAGKSTLMRTIATLQKPDSGNIKFDEIEVLEKPLELRKVLGYLPQDFGVYPRQTALQLLQYLAVLKGLSNKKQRAQIIEQVLELTNLAGVKNKNVSGYSGGMKQRFGIAQLLLNDPKLIIVDEPTAGLDPTERNRFLNILREIGTRSTVIFSTHIVEDIKELCTDMAIVNHGEVLLHKTPAQATVALNGKVWEKKILQNELTHAQGTYQVLSTGYNADDSIQLRVFDESRPGPNFISAAPKIEDVYFSTLHLTEPELS